MNILRRTLTAIRERGLLYTLREALPHLHRHHLRGRLPRRQQQLNGVSVRSKRLFDDVVPWGVGYREPENYEPGIIAGLRRHVEPGDDVVVVGGGWGVSSVVAAEEAGEDGSVRTYEASPEYSEYAAETARLNGVADRVNIETAVVGRYLSGKATSAVDRIVDPSELPDCDVLELDCEGAELEVLRNMDQRPRVLVVETHGHLGAPTDEVVTCMEDLSYEVDSRVLAERGELAPMAREDDVYVVTAVRA
jgi:hypothetical protein